MTEAKLQVRLKVKWQGSSPTESFPRKFAAYAGQGSISSRKNGHWLRRSYISTDVSTTCMNRGSSKKVKENERN